MSDLKVDENTIINKDFFSGVKSMVTCIICYNIIQEPVMCSKCENFFCTLCIKRLGYCPLKCKNYKIKGSLICKRLLSGLKIKCKCGKNLEYDSFGKHVETECARTNFKEKYFELKEKLMRIKDLILFN